MIRRILISAVLCLVLAWPALGQTSDPVVVPIGSKPVLDGTIRTDEWADAMVIEWSEESTLFLKSTPEFLFLAFRGTTRGVPSPLIVRDSERYALHASAALGTAIYKQDGDTWQLRQPFERQCRDRSCSAAAACRHGHAGQES
ncbi:hypothetical protein KKG90_06110 [Candidatus Bipolaricaulota bacterium]|nr:hypothetical protein [Candidatus Bipolaricaulota bacterium]